MAIQFPPERLSRSQLQVTNMAADRSYVVVGAAGTGKTLLALLRAQNVLDELKTDGVQDPKILFIVFNRPLQNYLKSIIQLVGLSEDQATTYHSWLWTPVYYMLLNRKPPQFDRYEHDWDRVRADLLMLHARGILSLDHVILDEAQDLPIELLEILTKISKAMTVFIDDRQKIGDGEGITAEQATNIVTGGDPYRRFVLSENHRNSQAIIDFARLFLPHGAIPPDAVNREGPKPVLIRYQGLYGFAQQVATHARNNPEQLVAAFLPNQSERRSFAACLAQAGATVDEYENNTRTPQFDPQAKGSVKLFTYQTFKGLEFDAVFMPQMDHSYFNDESEKKINQVMVGVTRAKTTLMLGASNLESPTSFVLQRVRQNLSLVEQRS